MTRIAPIVLAVVSLLGLFLVQPDPAGPALDDSTAAAATVSPTLAPRAADPVASPVARDRETRPAGLAYALVAGDVRRYRVLHETTVESTARLFGQTPAPTRQTIRVDGVWVERVLERVGRRARVGWSLEGGRMIVDDRGGPDPADLGREVVVEIDATGLVERLLFPSDLPAFVELWWQEWADAAVPVLPDRAASAWTAPGRDPLGDYRAVYRLRGDGAIERRKADHAARVPAGAPAPRTRVEGLDEYRFDRAAGCLVAGRGRIRTEGTVPDLLEMAGDRTFEYALLSADRHDPAVLRATVLAARGVGDMAALVAGSTVRRPGQMPDLEASEAPVAESLSELLDAIDDALAPPVDRGQAASLFLKITRLLGQDPVAVDAARGALLDDPVSWPLQEVLLDALADTGDPACQSLLTDVLGRADERLVARALASVPRIDAPTAGLVRAVELHLERAVGSTDRLRHALRATGALVRQTGDLDLLARLEGRGLRAVDLDDRLAFLDGLANSRHPSVVARMRAATGDDQPLPVRAAATAGLARIVDPSVASHLVEVVETELEAGTIVAFEAAEGLVYQQLETPPARRSAAARRALLERVLTAADARLRMAALDFAAAESNRSDVRERLEILAASDPDADVRERARRILAG